MIKLVAGSYIFAMIIWIWGYAAGRYEIFPYKQVEKVVQEVDAFVEGGRDGAKPVTFRERLAFHMQERRNLYPFSGFQQRDKDFSDEGYLLISRFSGLKKQVVIELVKVNGFETVHEWTPPVEEILAQGDRDEAENSPDGYRATHPLLMQDGSVIFHSGKGALVRLDKDSEIMWVINNHFHHSVEISSEGHIVVPVIMDDERPLVDLCYRDDGYAVVTTDGKIIERHSLTDMLLAHGERALLMGVGAFEHDRFHLNDAQPILRDKGMAKAGDVALSIRHLSTVLLFRPNTGEIVWLKTGPWLNQHDVNLLADGTYSIFGNDLLRIDGDLRKRGENRRDVRAAGDISEIYVYDPATERIATPYTDILTEAAMYTGVEGRSRILPNGDVFIEETERHRLLRVSKDSIRWEYVNGVGRKTSGTVNWCRYLTEGEVDLAWLP